ncbi:MAG: hypothetical protein LBF41_08235 [Deltaproteobacteria bacterium]|nr:hypothetical protein [Deltaproteobacteria bacterium]
MFREEKENKDFRGVFSEKEDPAETLAREASPAGAAEGGSVPERENPSEDKSTDDGPGPDAPSPDKTPPPAADDPVNGDPCGSVAGSVAGPAAPALSESVSDSAPAPPEADADDGIIDLSPDSEVSFDRGPGPDAGDGVPEDEEGEEGEEELAEAEKGEGGAGGESATEEGKGGEEAPPDSREEKQFRLVKYFSNVSILVIFVSCLILAAVMSGQAEDIIYDRVVEDTIMIMDNLNFQMYNHFLLPIYRDRGQAKLSEPDAYSFLNNVIQNTVYGFDISRVALYDALYGMMVYSSESATPVVVYRVSPETGKPVPSGSFADPISSYLEAVAKAYLPPSAEMMESLANQSAYPRTFWRAIGDIGRAEYLNYLKDRTVIRREDGDFLLAGFFPRGRFYIRCFKAMEDYYSDNISGVLEITRDVSAEYRQIAAMQYVALAIAVGATIFLTFTLRLVVARGEAIIHQRNAERALLNERLNQVERLVNLGRMVATVSHEIRNPLGIINSSADFLENNLKEKPGLERLARAIVDESERLSRIVTDFLDFARPQEPKFAPVIPEELLEEIFVLLEVDVSRAGVELKADLRPDPGPISGDGALLHRAFMNILVNAIQAMPDGGLLTVSTRIENRRDLAKESLGRLIIEVVDTGPGINVEALPNLFKPFYTTKTKGTGLGLVLVRNIVESHGGSLDLRNAREGGPGEGRGLRVSMSLPLAGDGL